MPIAMARGDKSTTTRNGKSALPREDDVRTTIVQLLRERGGGSCCPSEVARALAPAGWRSLMELVRRVAWQLAREGSLHILQRGRVVDGVRARGPIRFRLPGPCA
jgi:hypothetical protein